MTINYTLEVLMRFLPFLILIAALSFSAACKTPAPATEVADVSVADTMLPQDVTATVDAASDSSEVTASK